MWEALSERRPGIRDTTVARRRRPPTFGALVSAGKRNIYETHNLVNSVTNGARPGGVRARVILGLPSGFIA